MLKTPSQIEMLKINIPKTNWGQTSITESVEIHSVVQKCIFSIFVDAIQHLVKTKAQVDPFSPLFCPTCRNFTYLFCLVQVKTHAMKQLYCVKFLQEAIHISSKKGAIHIFPKIFGTAEGSLLDFQQQSTSSETFNDLCCW